jgi:hypothetical protein
MMSRTWRRTNREAQRIHCGARRAAGILLIDALITVVLLTVSTCAVLYSLTHSLEGLRQNRAGMLAKTAAATQMERVRSLPFDTLATGPFTVEAPLETLPDAAGQMFVCPYDPATGACGGADPNIRQVTVSVIIEARTWRLVTVISR